MPAGSGWRRMIDDEDALELNAGAELLEDIEQTASTMRKRSSRVANDVREVVGMEAEVEGVEDGADGGYAEVGFQMLVLVPHDGGDAVTRGDTGALQGRGELARAAVRDRAWWTGAGAVGFDGDDFDGREERPGAFEHAADQQRARHHGGLHGASGRIEM